MKNVCFVGPVYDCSGYGEAARSNILSLYKRGVSLCVKPFCFEKNRAALGSSPGISIIDGLVKKWKEGSFEYDIVICQLTPDMAVMNGVPGKYNIAYFAWETTKVHPNWVQCLNEMSEVWVPSSWNVDALKSSGVTVPVCKVPHGIAVETYSTVKRESFPLSVDESTYYFYSILQWQPRKNPEGLLRTYFSTFKNDENVALVLKAYIREGGQEEANIIASKILNIKRDMMLPSYPKILLITSILSDEQMKALHLNFDCCVSLHRSEGFGLPMMEAGLAGNPVIATGATGNLEFMNDQNSYLVNANWAYVREMSSFNSWYVGDGMWATPDELNASELMRFVFENRDKAKFLGEKLKLDITNNFNYNRIADIMVSRLKEISVKI